MIKIRPVAAALLLPLVLVGCGTTSPAKRTVVVTSTAPTADVPEAPVTVPGTTSVDATAATTGSAAASSGGSSDAQTSGSVPASSEAGSSVAESSFAGPYVTVDPLTQDCAKVLTAATMTAALGSEVTGEASVIVDVANPDRKTTGRLKCLYGVTPELSTGAVTVVLTQYQDAAAAAEQVGVTVSAEKKESAKVSKGSVKGIPADIMLRDGGLLVVIYDTWTLSIVVADGVVDEAALPAAMTTMADFALGQIVGA